MGLLRNVAIAVFAISLITFVALFGQLPALRKTPVGWLQRLLCISIPNRLKRIDISFTGGRITTGSQRLSQYLFYKKNPVVLVCFLLLLTGSAGLFLWHTIDQLPTHLLLPVPVLLGSPYLFTYLSVSYKAHYITTSNLKVRLNDYPYDHVIYRPRTGCRTCQQVKPARSKHCSLCGFCVAKCDHHCPWVNNCLGQGNYRYFLGLLFTLSILQFYGAYLSWWILAPYLTVNPNNPLFSMGRLDDLGHALVVAVNRGGISIAGVGLLAASTAFLPLGLFAYHCYLIWAGMTTNESQKWADWGDDMADGIAFKANRAVMQAHNHTRKIEASRQGRCDPALDVFDEDDVKMAWPVTNDQVLVSTKDGKPPRGQETMWKPVWSLDEVVNIYDLGGFQNLMDVLKGR